MLKKTWISILLVASLIWVAGCGSKTNESAQSSEAPAASGAVSAEKVSLTVWYWNRAIDDALLAKVSKQFPNVELKAEKIGGDFKAKFKTALAAGSGGPDIVTINNDWVSEFMLNKDKFANLLEVGSDDALKSLYLDWKWRQTMTPDGSFQIGLPMDTGPTAMYYRTDLFEKAGLQADPAQVAGNITSWESYLEAGKKLTASISGGKKVYMIDNISNLFTQVMSQSDKLFFDEKDNFIGDQAHVKRAWDIATQFHQAGLSAKVVGGTPEWNAALNNNDIASFVGAVWWGPVLEDGAPDTAGKWRVARAPGGDGNQGGSSIAITKQSKHPKEAFEVIKWLMNPENQLNSLETINLFPSTPSVFTDTRMIPEKKFFGGQKINEVFMKSAENVKAAYRGAQSPTVASVFDQELTNVEKQNKDPEKAWNDAISQIKRELSH
jgi:cellobiose transport system substrate-binding protein